MYFSRNHGDNISLHMYLCLLDLFQVVMTPSLRILHCSLHHLGPWTWCHRSSDGGTGLWYWTAGPLVLHHPSSLINRIMSTVTVFLLSGYLPNMTSRTNITGRKGKKRIKEIDITSIVTVTVISLLFNVEFSQKSLYWISYIKRRIRLALSLVIFVH